MRIAVFGASGGIGKFVVKHALEQGYEVNAYVRNPKALQGVDANLKVIVGELDQYESIKKAIAGCDAVICAIGVPMKFSYGSMASLEGHKHILTAMAELGVSRLIDWATPSVRFEKDQPSFVTIVPGILASLVFPKAKRELVEIAKLIRSTDLKWTLVRFLAPKNSPYTGQVKISFGSQKMSFNISREDIAVFMVKQIHDSTYVGSMPIIGS